MVTEPKLDLDQIRAVIKIASESPDVAELEVASETFKVVVKKVAGSVRAVVSTSSPSASSSPVATVSSAPSAAATESTSQLVPITAPMVGTFYRAPKPDASPFVAEGDLVEPGQAVCIIEAMKLFNEIQSEVRGRVTRILVDNASPVEYGQPLMLVDTTAS
jgi:acetyl-CoA carboxylase biotin carboxyl carrier protein